MRRTPSRAIAACWLTAWSKIHSVSWRTQPVCSAKGMNSPRRRPDPKPDRRLGPDVDPHRVAGRALRQLAGALFQQMLPDALGQAQAVGQLAVGVAVDVLADHHEARALHQQQRQ